MSTGFSVDKTGPTSRQNRFVESKTICLKQRSFFKALRARQEAEAAKLVNDAHLLEEAGCCACVVEKIPAALTQRLVKELSIPVIGIGGGTADGQVLVVNDMLGMTQGFSPKFLRRYADLHTIMTDAIGQYVADVKSCDFPNENEKY